MRKTPKVNEVNEFLEIASDFEDPLEVLRESLSNSYDAGATEVSITIRNQPRGSDIVIEDDGCGMNERDLESFFDLGNSRKTDSIGYKGHGTKIFYKSDDVAVTTTRNGTSYRAVMENPWQKLNRRELPEYEVTTSDVRTGNSGTRIQISNFRSGEGFAPSELTYNKIHHYLKWKTIAGSTAHYFGDDHREMDIRVSLDGDIDDTREQLVTTNRLELPAEQQEPDESRFPEERMCKHYPPREIDIPHDGGTATIQIVGMVGGKQARNELPTYGKHSAQFGIWLAKDHIKVERINDVISHDNEFIHFFFIVNCQALELSANRETIRNKSSAVFRAIKSEADYFLSKVANDPWFTDYLRIRKQAEHQRRVKRESDALTERREAIETRATFEPSNSAEVLLALERATRTTSESALTVEDYAPDADVHAIVRQAGRLQNTAVYPQLTDLFEAHAPLGAIDLVVCWDVGDPAVLRERERDGYLGGEVTVDLDDGAIRYTVDDQQYIEVLEVAPLSPEETPPRIDAE
jgi:hypothetical protein